MNEKTTTSINELPQKWREEARDQEINTYGCGFSEAKIDCAAELEAALAVADTAAAEQQWQPIDRPCRKWAFDEWYEGDEGIAASRPMPPSYPDPKSWMKSALRAAFKAGIRHEKSLRKAAPTPPKP